MNQFITIIAKGDNWVVAHCPELRIVSEGLTEDEALQNLRAAVEKYLVNAEKPTDEWGRGHAEDGRAA